MQDRILIGPSSFGEIDDYATTQLEEAGFEIIKNPYGRKIKKEELQELLSDKVVGLIAGLEIIDREIILNSNLKAISRLGSGISNIDMKSIEEKGIKLSYIPDGPTQSVAELTISNIINLSRKTFEMNKELKDNRNWHRIYGNEISGKCILIIGFGKIGQKVSQILTTIGANVIACDPYLKNQDDYSVKFYDLHRGLELADIVSIHVSGQKQIISDKEIKLLKDGVIICNSSRGEAINETAFKKALDNGKIGGAWLDTYIEEPYSGDLLNYNQCIYTPHVSSLTYECRVRMEKIATNNILKDLI